MQNILPPNNRTSGKLTSPLSNIKITLTKLNYLLTMGSEFLRIFM